jgi:undecaprenyl-diphosphatase
MTIFQAVILGFVQGFTEFLPVSSTGHLVLTRFFFEIGGTHALAFDAVLHLATAAAVIVYFWRDLVRLAHAVLRKLARMPVDPKDITLIMALIIGTIPAVIFGLLLESTMDTLFRNPLLVAGVLVVGSLLFVYAEWIYLNTPRQGTLTVRKGLYIGLFQSLALVPGMSRSGSSIAGAMLLGLTREEAAKFSFLLAIPVIVGAGSKKLLELASLNEPVTWTPILVGAAVAFVVGLMAIRFMLGFVRRYSLWPFVWYRIVLAIVVAFFVLAAQ